MLELHNILWVIPGVVFIYLYNRFRPDKKTAMAVNLSGWPYLFFLVVIATLTWLPAELIVECCEWETELKQRTVTLLISLVLTSILLLLSQLDKIASWIFLPVQDNFYKKCVEWENKEILLTLKNGKAYHGLLWKYPDSPKSRYDSQTISIVPSKSGYRTEENKEVKWNTYYPEYEGKNDLVEMEIIIPRSEIITFGKFNNKAFEHFEKQIKKQKS